jgi:hypothetical protein
MVGLLFGAAAPAAAQGAAPANVALSYALITDSIADVGNGWVAAGALRVYRFTNIVVEAGGNYKTQDNGTEVRIHGFMSGVRFASPRDPSLSPFAQVLLGVECYCGSTVTFGEISKRLALQPGAGIDLKVSPLLALRVQADVRRAAGDDDFDAATRFRFAAGLVVRFGD